VIDELFALYEKTEPPMNHVFAIHKLLRECCIDEDWRKNDIKKLWSAMDELRCALVSAQEEIDSIMFDIKERV